MYIVRLGTSHVRGRDPVNGAAGCRLLADFDPFLLRSCCRSTKRHKVRSKQQLQRPILPTGHCLDEADAARGWFHAKKTHPIWARLLETDQTVTTLEGEESDKCRCRRKPPGACKKSCVRVWESLLPRKPHLRRLTHRCGVDAEN